MTHKSHQLTLRGLDEGLRGKLEQLAREQGLSLNQAALRLIRKGAGLDRSGRPEVVGSSLDHLIGTWSDAEAEEFAEALSDLDRIDEDLWR